MISKLMMLGPETEINARSYRLAEEPMDNLNGYGTLQTSDLFKEWMLLQGASEQTSLWEEFVSLPTLAEKVFEKEVGDGSSSSSNSVHLFSLKHF